MEETNLEDIHENESILGANIDKLQVDIDGNKPFLGTYIDELKPDNDNNLDNIVPEVTKHSNEKRLSHQGKRYNQRIGCVSHLGIL